MGGGDRPATKGEQESFLKEMGEIAGQASEEKRGRTLMNMKRETIRAGANFYLGIWDEEQKIHTFQPGDQRSTRLEVLEEILQQQEAHPELPKNTWALIAISSKTEVLT